MGKVLIEIDNYNKIRKDLRSAEAVIKKQVRELDKGLAGEIADVVPEFTPHKSGALIRSVKGGADSKGAYVKAGTSARVPYAPVIHWGWPARGIKRSGFIIRALGKVGREHQGLQTAYLASLEEILNQTLES